MSNPNLYNFITSELVQEFISINLNTLFYMSIPVLKLALIVIEFSSDYFNVTFTMFDVLFMFSVLVWTLLVNIYNRNTGTSLNSTDFSNSHLLGFFKFTSLSSYKTLFNSFFSK